MNSANDQSLIEALEEPGLIVEALIVTLANEPARMLLGAGIQGKDVRLAIRHPAAVERILAGRSADVDITGIGEFGRPWRLSVRELGGKRLLVRLFDTSASVAADKIRTDFVANASHELRTPLSTILGYAEPLADDAVMTDAERAQLASIIGLEAKRMVRIIDDLMSLSRVEAGRFDIPHEQVSLPDLLDAAVGNIKRSPGARSCLFETRVGEGVGSVTGDSAQLAQLLDNLLSNALRYGCPGGRGTIRSSLTADGAWVTIIVEDEGPGIAKAHIPHLTKRFYKVDDSRNRDHGGTGLGLALVKHIVERHRGRLVIESERGLGTRVTVRLPSHLQ